MAGKLTDKEVRIWLIFSHQNCSFLSELSKNVLREVCLYLQDCLYYCVLGDVLKVYNLETGQVTTKDIQHHSNGAPRTVCIRMRK